MINKFLKLFLLVSAVLAIVSEARDHDYMFGVTGVVTAEDGTPMQDAEVTLEVNGPIYEGVATVGTVKHLTNSSGGFVFMYTSHKRSQKYAITARKEGFEPQSASGSAPPSGHHKIRLMRARGKPGDINDK